MPSISLRPFLILLGVLFGSIVGFHCLIGRALPLLSIRGGSLYASDFAYHLLMAQCLWFEGAGAPYTLQVQTAVLGRAYGGSVPGAMPVGVSPIGFLLWAPYASVARGSFNLANSAWVVSSVVVFGAALIELRRLYGRRTFPVLVMFLAVLSDTFGGAVVLGQTSILAAAVLMAMTVQIRRNGTELDRTLVLYGVLTAIKPTYLVVSLLLLLGSGRRREFAWTVIGCLAVCLALTPVMGVGWLGDYVYALRGYTLEVTPTVYRSSLVPETMNVFRFAFAALLDSHAAYVVAKALLGCGLAIAALTAALGRGGVRPALIALAMLLLFAPISGQYEDLLVIVPALAVWGSGKVRLGTPTLVVEIVLLIVTLNFMPLRALVPLPLLWCAKAGVLFLPLVMTREDEKS